MNVPYFLVYLQLYIILFAECRTRKDFKAIQIEIGPQWPGKEINARGASLKHGKLRLTRISYLNLCRAQYT